MKHPERRPREPLSRYKIQDFPSARYVADNHAYPCELVNLSCNFHLSR